MNIEKREEFIFKIRQISKENNVVQFDNLLKSDLTPKYLFGSYSQKDRIDIDYERYYSLFTNLCEDGNLAFVKSAIEKSDFTNNEHFFGIATATGLVRACEGNHINIVKYLVEVDKKYQYIIGEKNGINKKVSKTIDLKDSKVKFIEYPALKSAIRYAFYRTGGNMDLIEYLLFSEELVNHPRVHYDDLMPIFLSANLTLFNKSLEKAHNDWKIILGENFDILSLFKILEKNDENTVKMAEYLIYNLKIYDYPGAKEQISQVPVLNRLYQVHQLSNELEQSLDKENNKKPKL